MTKKPMLVGFTGTRQGMTDAQADSFDSIVVGLFYGSGKKREFHHGDCIGADVDAVDIVSSLSGVYIHSHPCVLTRQRAFTQSDIEYKAMAPLQRNKMIVQATDILIACPSGTEEERRSGTWATIRYARTADKKIYIIWPDGSIKEEGTDG